MVPLCVGTFWCQKVAGADGTMKGLWTDTTVAAGKVSRAVFMLVVRLCVGGPGVICVCYAVDCVCLVMICV